MRTCDFEGCDRKHKARGFCSKHYERYTKHGDPSVTKKPPGPGYGYERKDTPKATSPPSTKDLNWIAGFLEGEGHILKTVGSHRVEARQVQKSPLIKLQKLLGGKIHYEKKEDPHSDIHNWQVCGSRARGVMMTIYTLMSTKRQNEISIALSDDNEQMEGNT